MASTPSASTPESLSRLKLSMRKGWAKIEDDLVAFIYGSNYIEVTGSNRDITEQLCHRIFRGEEAVSTLVEERSPEYEEARAVLVALKRPSTFDDVIRSQQEVINHAQALDVAINHAILDNLPTTEEFLKEVHKRTWEIAARHGKGFKQKSVFIRASVVPRYMEELIADLQADMITAESTKSVDIDPFDLANRYCHRLVCIHPFGDGNGRMRRILLNILLMKYAGCVSIFGGNATERQEYMDLASRGNKKFHQEDMDVAETDKKGHRELTIFTMAVR